jgi:hypothetical protein
MRAGGGRRGGRRWGKPERVGGLKWPRLKWLDLMCLVFAAVFVGVLPQGVAGETGGGNACTWNYNDLHWDLSSLVRRRPLVPQ